MQIRCRNQFVFYQSRTDVYGCLQIITSVIFNVEYYTNKTNIKLILMFKAGMVYESRYKHNQVLDAIY